MANSSNTWGGNWVITVNVAENPKIKFKPNGAVSPSYQRFALYRTGITVAEYKALVLCSPAGGKGYAAADLIWDTARAFITIAPPTAISAPQTARAPLPAIPATPVNAALVAAALGQQHATLAETAARLGVGVSAGATVTKGQAKHAA